MDVLACFIISSLPHLFLPTNILSDGLNILFYSWNGSIFFARNLVIGPHCEPKEPSNSKTN